MLAFPKRETIAGVALTDLTPTQTPVGKPCLLQGREKTVEVKQRGRFSFTLDFDIFSIVYDKIRICQDLHDYFYLKVIIMS